MRLAGDEAGVLEHLGDRLVQATWIGHVRASDLGRIPEVHDRRVVRTEAGIGQQLLSTLRVVRVRLDTGQDRVIPAARRRYFRAGTGRFRRQA